MVGVEEKGEDREDDYGEYADDDAAAQVLAQSYGVVESPYGGGWDELRKATGEHPGTGTKLA